MDCSNKILRLFDRIYLEGEEMIRANFVAYLLRPAPIRFKSGVSLCALSGLHYDKMDRLWRGSVPADLYPIYLALVMGDIDAVYRILDVRFAFYRNFMVQTIYQRLYQLKVLRLRQDLIRVVRHWLRMTRIERNLGFGRC